MLKLGDICLGHYGYGMEIYNFYVVTKITEKTVTLEQIKKRTIGGDGFTPTVVPDVKYSILGDKLYTPTGKKLTRRLGKSCVKDESGYGYIKLENVSEDILSRGFQEDHLD